MGTMGIPNKPGRVALNCHGSPNGSVNRTWSAAVKFKPGPRENTASMRLKGMNWTVIDDRIEHVTVPLVDEKP